MPEGATEEQVRTELEKNTEKYPAWRDLSVKLREINANIEREMADVRRRVGERIREEVGNLRNDVKERR